MGRTLAEKCHLTGEGAHGRGRTWGLSGRFRLLSGLKLVGYRLCPTDMFCLSNIILFLKILSVINA